MTKSGLNYLAVNHIIYSNGNPLKGHTEMAQAQATAEYDIDKGVTGMGNRKVHYCRIRFQNSEVAFGVGEAEKDATERAKDDIRSKISKLRSILKKLSH